MDFVHGSRIEPRDIGGPAAMTDGVKAALAHLSMMLLVIALAVNTTAASERSFRLFPQVWGDVIVVTDMTPEGRALERATPEQPVYYLGQSLGRRLGSIPGDREPSVAEMNQVVTDILAKQGYVGATPGVNEASLFIVIQWGYLRPQGSDLFWFLGYDAREDIGAAVFPGQLGAEVFRRNFRSRWIETVLEGAREPIYGIIVTAFDYESASTPAPVIYWQTRIGLPASGKSMSQALPTMLVAAGPTIGRETKIPVLQSADTARRGRVEIGTVDVLEVMDTPPAAR
jgi:hypothetical protein